MGQKTCQARKRLENVVSCNQIQEAGFCSNLFQKEMRDVNTIMGRRRSGIGLPPAGRRK